MAVRARFILGVALVSAMLVAVGGASGAAPQHRVAADQVNWTQYHNAPTHQGLNRREHVVGPDNVRDLSLSWIGNGSTTVEDLVFRSSPTVVDGFVYFGTDAGQLL